MGKFDIEEPAKDLTQILQEKADIARDRYRPLVGIREILLEAKSEIEQLRVKAEELNAEVARLNQVAKY
jgi:hypothetical protein